MSAHLSRAAQQMIAKVLEGHELRIEKDRVVVGPITFILNNRAISLLNEQAFENAGQFDRLQSRTGKVDTTRGVLEAPAAIPSAEPGESPGPRSTDERG